MSKILVFLLPIGLFAIFLIIKFCFPEEYFYLVQEDAPIECVQAIMYFLTSLIAFGISMWCKKNAFIAYGFLHLMLGILFLFVAIEEVSWGQRILGIAPPSYFEQHNYQKELTIHNLNLFQPLLIRLYILVGAIGSFGWIFKPQSRLCNFILPEWYLSSYFLFALSIYTIFYFYTPTSGGFIIWRDQEPAEFLLALGFFFVIVNNIICLKVLKSELQFKEKFSTFALPQVERDINFTLTRPSESLRMS